MERKRLRREARDARRAFVESLSPAVRAALEQALAEQLAPAVAAARLVGAHAAAGSEIDASAALIGAEGRVAWPRLREDGGLSFHRCDRAGLVDGRHGVAEAPPGLPEVFPDLLLVPLLLFDRQGNRLGQGGGHFDRTLARLRRMGSASGPVRAVGVAFDMQEVASLPVEPWDAPLDAIATPSRFHWFQRGARAVP
ncbi:5-formyltetrahydrofolate cyclo-ligase [Thermaurantiacus sp.]